MAAFWILRADIGDEFFFGPSNSVRVTNAVPVDFAHLTVLIAASFSVLIILRVREFQ